MKGIRILIFLFLVIATFHLKPIEAGLFTPAVAYITIMDTPTCGEANGTIEIQVRPPLGLNFGATCTLTFYGSPTLTVTNLLANTTDFCLIFFCYNTTFSNVPVGNHTLTCDNGLTGLLLNSQTNITIPIGTNDISPAAIAASVIPQCGPGGSPGEISVTTPWGDSCAFPSSDFTQSPSCVFVEWAVQNASSTWTTLPSTSLNLTDLYAGNYSLSLMTNIGRCPATWYFTVDPPPESAVNTSASLAPSCPTPLGTELTLTPQFNLTYLAVSALNNFTISVLSTVSGWQSADYIGSGPFTIAVDNNLDTNFKVRSLQFPFCVFQGVASAGGSLLTGFTPPGQEVVTNVTSIAGAVNLSGSVPAGLVNWTQGGNFQSLLDSQPYQVTSAGFVQATYLVNTCVVTSNFTLYQEFALTVVNSTDCTCNTSGTGTVTLEIFGGVPPFTFLLSLISNGSVVVEDVVALGPFFTLSNLDNDFYLLTLNDNASQTRTVPFSIGFSNVMALSTQLQVDYTACPSTNLTFWALGGGGSYTYSASLPGGQSVGSTFVLPGLAGGDNVVITATDQLGCVVSQPIVISDPGSAFSVSPAIVGPAVCQQQASGTVSIPLSYAVLGPFQIISELKDARTGNVISPVRNLVKPPFVTLNGLVPARYRAEFTSSSCPTDRHIILFDVQALPTPQLTFDQVLYAPCGGLSSIAGTVTAITPTYTLSVANQDDGQLVWQNVLSTHSFTAPDLLPGRYSLTVTNNNDCSSALLNVTISETDLMGFRVAIVNLTAASSCWHGHDGSVTFSVSRGVPPYRCRVSFLSNSLPEQGNYTSRLITVNSTEATVKLTGLPVAGRYGISITDSNSTNSCSAWVPFSLNAVNISDQDMDGICDVADNCGLVANFNQSDIDGDGVGDACDICPFFGSNTKDSDRDGTPDCLDQCPLTPGIVNKSSCGCVLQADCDCPVALSCQDITFVVEEENQTTTITFSGNSSIIGMGLSRGDQNRTIETLLAWSSLTEFDPHTSKVIKVLDLANLTWNRMVKSADPGAVALVEYQATHQFLGAVCPFKVILAYRFSAPNSSTTEQGISFYFPNAGTKFSMQLLGCWGFAKTSNQLFATFRYLLQDSYFVAPPTDCNGKSLSPASPISVSNATGKYQTISLHTADGGVVQTQVLTVAQVDGVTVKVPFHLQSIRGQIRLQFPYFSNNVTYDPTLMLLLGPPVDSESCTSGLSWYGPLAALAAAAAIVGVIIVAILFVPPVSQAFYGKEGMRVNRVRSVGDKFPTTRLEPNTASTFPTRIPSNPASTFPTYMPSNPHSTFPKHTSLHTTENW